MQILTQMTNFLTKISSLECREHSLQEGAYTMMYSILILIAAEAGYATDHSPLKLNQSPFFPNKRKFRDFLHLEPELFIDEYAF